MAKRFTFTGRTNTELDIEKATPLDYAVGPYKSSTTTPFAITVIEFPATGSDATLDYGSVYTDKWSRTYDSSNPLSEIEVTSVDDDGNTFIVSTPLERDMPVHLSADEAPPGLNPSLTNISSGGEGPFMSQTFFVKPLELTDTAQDGTGQGRVQLRTTPWNDTDGSGIVLSATPNTTYGSPINFKLTPGHTNRIGVSNAQSIANITASAFKTFLQDKYNISNVKKITATIELQGEPSNEYYTDPNYNGGS